MMNKLLSFLKLRLIETIGIITILCSFIYIFTLANYSADNSLLIFTNQNINILFSNYLYSLSDFLLQAFGITSFLIFGSLFFKLFGDSSFWLPDNGYGGFLGKYLMSLIPIELYQFKTEISYTCLAIGISFFFLSLGLTFKNWMNLIKTFSSIIISFVSRIFKKRKNEAPDIVEDLGLSEEVPSINKSFKPNTSEAQASLNLNDSFDEQTDFTKFEYKLP